MALSRKMPLVVVHTIHDPVSSSRVRYEISTSGDLTEIIVYFRHTGIVDSFTGKFGYNTSFYRYTRQLVDHLVGSYGRPACIHVHVPVKMGRVAMQAQKKWGMPYLVSEQSSKYLPGIEDGYDRRSLFYRLTVKLVFRKALAVSNVSEALAKLIGQISGRNDVQVIRNVADPEIFRYTANTSSVFRFIHVSTLKEQKNIKGILRVFEKLAKQQNVELLVLGGGEDELTLIRGQYTGAGWLKLEGTVDHSRVAGFMQQSSSMVMFSRDENFPCVIVEALCCGLPVVTSDAGGCAEAITDTNGLVVPAGDEEKLLQALKIIIANYHQYDRAAIARDAAALYGIDKIAEDFLAFYRGAGVRI